MRVYWLHQAHCLQSCDHSQDRRSCSCHEERNLCQSCTMPSRAGLCNSRFNELRGRSVYTSSVSDCHLRNVLSGKVEKAARKFEPFVSPKNSTDSLVVDPYSLCSRRCRNCCDSTCSVQEVRCKSTYPRPKMTILQLSSQSRGVLKKYTRRSSLQLAATKNASILLAILESRKTAFSIPAVSSLLKKSGAKQWVVASI